MKISRKGKGRRRSGGTKAVVQARKNDTLKSSGSSQSELLNLQRTIGNNAVQRLYETGQLQAKLKIGQPNDSFEREADSVADRVMNMPEPKISRQEEDKEEEVQAKSLAETITPLVQREAGPEEEEEVRKQPEEEEEKTAQAKMLQRQAEKEEEEEVQKQPEEEEEKTAQAKGDGGGPSTAPSSVESGINSLREGGSPLSESNRAFFEPRFGADFSGVRVHTGSNANHLARSVNAKAFTVGRDVVFGSCQYSPETTGGKKLLAHELTHTVQQVGILNTHLQKKSKEKVKNK